MINLFGAKENEKPNISEEQYHQLLQNLQIGVILVNFETGDVFDVNKFLQDLTEYPRESFLNKHLWSIDALKTPKLSKNTFEVIKKDGQIILENLTLKTRSGKEIIVTIAAKAYPIDGNNIIQCNIIDKTKCKLTEKELANNAYFFKESQRVADIGSYKTDFTLDRWESSEIMDKIFGIDENYGRTVSGWLDIVHPDDRKMMDEYLQNEVIAKRKPFAKEYRIIRKNDGETRWVFGSGQVKFGENGKILSMVGTIQDITDRKNAELALKKERDLVQHYLDAVETIIVALDSEGKITKINRKGCELFEKTENELLGKSWFSECLPQPEGMRDVYPVFLKLMSGELGNTEYYENPVVSKSGQRRQVAWHNVLLRDDSGKITGTLSSGEDITEQKKEQEELRKSKEEVQKKLEEIEKINRLMIGRELKMAELKEKINELKRQKNIK